MTIVFRCYIKNILLLAQNIFVKGNQFMILI